MINKAYILNEVLPLVKERGRKLGSLLIENLYSNKEKEIIVELLKYQNPDKGFGQALEPDVRMPNSSIVATDMAVTILDEIHDEEIKKNVVRDIVEYYEQTYNEEKGRFIMVTEEVEKYPHAIWWNFKDIETNFTYGNPDPEVIGFLFKYHQYTKKLDINSLINNVIDYIKNGFQKEAGMHHLLSVLKFYKRVDEDIKNIIKSDIMNVVNRLVETEKSKWNEYVLEPYKIALIDKGFLINHADSLEQNLLIIKSNIENKAVKVPWKWYQYDEVFEEIKDEWLGHLYFEMIKVTKLI